MGEEVANDDVVKYVREWKVAEWVWVKSKDSQTGCEGKGGSEERG